MKVCKEVQVEISGHDLNQNISIVCFLQTH